MKKLFALVSVLLLIVVVLYAFDVSGLRGTTDTIRGYHTVETVVTENGATLVNNGVQVEADGGVAPAGTKIVLSTTSNSQGFLNDPADLTTRLGMGFDIYLDNGQQPQTPVKVTYLQDEKNNFLRKFAGVESPTPDTPSTLFFITARSDTNELEVIQPEIVYDQYENSEEKVIDSASVMMSHFSKGEFRWWNWKRSVHISRTISTSGSVLGPPLHPTASAALRNCQTQRWWPIALSSRTPRSTTSCGPAWSRHQVVRASPSTRTTEDRG